MKEFNEKYFASLNPLAKKRYAMWLFESPGYQASMFRGMQRAVDKGSEKELAEYAEAYPEEAVWFDKHLKKSPDAIEVQTNLFKINNTENG